MGNVSKCKYSCSCDETAITSCASGSGSRHASIYRLKVDVTGERYLISYFLLHKQWNSAQSWIPTGFHTRLKTNPSTAHIQISPGSALPLVKSTRSLKWETRRQHISVFTWVCIYMYSTRRSVCCVYQTCSCLVQPVAEQYMNYDYTFLYHQINGCPNKMKCSFTPCDHHLSIGIWKMIKCKRKEKKNIRKLHWFQKKCHLGKINLYAFTTCWPVTLCCGPKGKSERCHSLFQTDIVCEQHVPLLELPSHPGATQCHIAGQSPRKWCHPLWT